MSERDDIEITAVSPLYETDPIGYENQKRFINGVIVIKTSLRPEKLLEVLLVIEDAMGRKRGVKWGSRNIDLDLLLYNDLIIKEINLTVPHPRLHERRFVLQPLSDIYPDFFHPEIKKSIGELLGLLGQEQKIERIEDEIKDF